MPRKSQKADPKQVGTTVALRDVFGDKTVLPTCKIRFDDDILLTLIPDVLHMFLMYAALNARAFETLFGLI